MYIKTIYLKNGVYGCFIYIDKKKYLGICNIGHNPTFNYVEKKYCSART